MTVGLEPNTQFKMILTQASLILVFVALLGNGIDESLTYPILKPTDRIMLGLFCIIVVLSVIAVLIIQNSILNIKLAKKFLDSLKMNKRGNLRQVHTEKQEPFVMDLD